MHAQPGSCRSCGAPLPEGAAFCPSCGTAVGSALDRDEVPPNAIPTDVTVARAEPRWFGLTPASVVLALAAVDLAVGVVLVALGAVVPALLLLGVGLLLIAAFLEVARRKPDVRGLGRTARAADTMRERVGVSAQNLRARTAARHAIAKRRAEALQLDGERAQLFRALGEATYRGEPDAELRERVAAVEARQTQLAAEAAEIARASTDYVKRANLAVQRTEIKDPRTE